MSESNIKHPRARGIAVLTEKPQCLALVVCDYVIEDARTHKKSLIGIFNRLYSQKFPAMHPRLVVFASLTGGKGKFSVEIRMSPLSDIDGSEPLFNIKGDGEWKNPLEVLELSFEIQRIVFPTDGQYAIDVLINDDLVSTRRFVATLSPK